MSASLHESTAKRGSNARSIKQNLIAFPTNIIVGKSASMLCLAWHVWLVFVGIVHYSMCWCFLRPASGTKISPAECQLLSTLYRYILCSHCCNVENLVPKGLCNIMRKRQSFARGIRTVWETLLLLQEHLYYSVHEYRLGLYRHRKTPLSDTVIWEISYTGWAMIS